MRPFSEWYLDYNVSTFSLLSQSRKFFGLILQRISNLLFYKQLLKINTKFQHNPAPLLEARRLYNESEASRREAVF